MKHIEITYIPNTFNYGSCMMAVAVITFLKSALKEVSFYVDCQTNEDLERLKQETRFKAIYTNANYEDIIKNTTPSQEGIRIILGGDSISEYYSISATVKRLKLIQSLSRNNKVFLLGQSLGPFSGERIALAQECLKDVFIYTRSNSNYTYLKSLGLSHIISGYDLAFRPLPYETKTAAILNQYHLLPNEYVTLVPSGLYKKYTINRREYIDEYRSIINGLLALPEMKHKKLLLLPHVTVSGSDIEIINELVPLLSPEVQKKLIVIKNSMLPAQARILLGNGLFTITGRMHAAVSTFYMKKPALSLSYSVKYKGVIGEGLDLEPLIIEAADETLWHNHEVSKEVLKKAKYILDNYNELVEKISFQTARVAYELDKELNAFAQDLLAK